MPVGGYAYLVSFVIVGISGFQSRRRYFRSQTAKAVVRVPVDLVIVIDRLFQNTPHLVVLVGECAVVAPLFLQQTVPGTGCHISVKIPITGHHI